MKSNLLGRFIVIILVTLASAWLVWKIPPRLGIDLAGGTALLYELDTSKLGEGENVSEVAGRVIDVLRQRVDPKGQKNIIWRVVGGKRIQIQMPYPPQVTLNAQKARDEAAKELEAVVWRPTSIDNAVRLTNPQERADAFKQFAPADSEEYKRLEALAKSRQEFDEADTARRAPVPPSTMPGADPAAQALERARVMARVTTASDALAKSREAVMASSADMATLQNLLKNAADNPDNPAAEEELKNYAGKFPRQKDKIEKYVAAYQEYRRISGGGVDDPDELKRLVTRAGVLDFRIAVLPTEVGGATGRDYLDAIQSLNQHGPEQQVTVNGTKARWFAVDPNGKDNFRDGYVTAPFAGEVYLLCYDDSALNNPAPKSLTHSDPARKPWSVKARTPYYDPQQGVTLPFDLDPVGGAYMGELTESNMKHPMAILLDDRAMSAPNINGHITNSGVITFGSGGTGVGRRSTEAIQKEANELKRIMDAGSLPATLQPQPISVQEISSNMGADNITAGKQSAYYAVMAVVAFMLIYYTITGFFADLALMLNLLLVLATMAMFSGTFTLPGIAGLVLTLGMAVDANVLINERIREEIHRGASLWMAIKQGYDKVFWTIFDANLTCSLTAIVLYEVGSEDVKGFGLTLLIGLVIHMFTALFVTRTFMMAAVKWNILRAIDDHSITEYFKEIFTFTWLRNGHFPFMKVITVSNIDWIGKRYIFWGISAVVTVAGITAFIMRGEDKYDIEFRGGTQITFHLRQPGPGETALTLEQVREKIASLGTPEKSEYKKELEELKDASVYTIGKPEDLAFEMQTTIRNKPQNFGETLPGPVAEAFGIDPRDIVVRTNPDATTARLVLAKPGTNATTTPLLPDVTRRIRALKDRPDLSDLGDAQVVEIANAPGQFDIVIPNSNIQRILVAPLADAFKDYIDVTPELNIKNKRAEARDMESAGRIVPITKGQLDQVFALTDARDIPAEDVREFEKGAAILLEDISPAITPEKLRARIDSTRRGSEFQNVPNRRFAVIPITVKDASGKDVNAGSGLAAGQTETRPMTRAAIVTADPSHGYDAENENTVALWRSKVANSEWNIIKTSLDQGKVFDGVTSFDAVVANQAKIQALLAILISLVLIVLYVWVRFGGIWYGIGAIVSLLHDAIVAVAATVLSGAIYRHVFNQHPYFLITDFKINLTMIAAYLTIIGYSVNDTIVIFDRVRELRGKSMAPLTKKIVNDAINQCFGRTIWTTFTVFIVLLIMYVWGGEGVRGFSFAMLIGVLTGAYSTLAIASPLLLSTGTAVQVGATTENPFQRKKRDDDTEPPLTEPAV